MTVEQRLDALVEECSSTHGTRRVVLLLLIQRMYERIHRGPDGTRGFQNLLYTLLEEANAGEA